MSDPKAAFARHVARIVAAGLIPERARRLDVLDLSCGRGDVLLEVAGRLPSGSRVVGVCDDRAQLDALHARLAIIHGHHAIFPRHELPDRLPFADGVFDRVWAGLASTSLEPLRPVLRQALRVLRPGGQLIIVALLRDTLMDLMRIAGQFMNNHEDSLRMRPLALDHARALDRAAWEDAVRKSGAIDVETSTHHFELEVGTPISDDPVLLESIVPVWLGADAKTNAETLSYLNGFMKAAFILPISMIRVVCKRGDAPPRAAIG
ncbi:MAG: class I SAM-dependent methyltransferase [Myxococcota bacterium]